MKEVYDVDYERIRGLIQLMIRTYNSARQDVYDDVCHTRSIEPSDGMMIGLGANHWFHRRMSSEHLFTHEYDGIRYRVIRSKGTYYYIVEGPDWYYNVKFESDISRQRHGSSIPRMLFHTQHESTFPVGTEKQCANLVIYYQKDRDGICRFDLARTTQPGKYFYDRSVTLLEIRFKGGYDEGLPFNETSQPISPIPRTTIGQRIAANNDASL